jgi:UDP-glucose 4-epimerase
VKVVVTGASGFLGREIIGKLVSANIDHVGVSRRQISDFHIVESYRNAPDGDVLIHLAETNDRALANRGGALCERDAAEIIKCLSKRYKKIIYASSAVLYGDECDSPRSELDAIVPVDIYTNIKRTSEDVVLNGGGIVARFSNIFGPGMSRATVIMAILEQLGLEGPLTLHDTSPVRDFLWIEDAADAVLAMILNPLQGIYNVGSGRGTSIYELAAIALKASNEKDRQIMSKNSFYKRSILITDIKKLTSSCGWMPKIELSIGMQNMVNLMKVERIK